MGGGVRKGKRGLRKLGNIDCNLRFKLRERRCRGTDVGLEISNNKGVLALILFAKLLKEVITLVVCVCLSRFHPSGVNSEIFIDQSIDLGMETLDLIDTIGNLSLKTMNQLLKLAQFLAGVEFQRLRFVHRSIPTNQRSLPHKTFLD
jgi:hypothetical protein